MENCRVCLQLSDNLCLISEDYWEPFSLITGISLLEGIEEYLCKSCLGRLIYAQKFRDEAQLADSWFKEHKRSTTKAEPAPEYIEEETLLEEEEYLIESIIEHEPRIRLVSGFTTIDPEEEQEMQINPNEIIIVSLPYTCDLCPNSAKFATKQSLSLHMDQLHREKPKRFTSRSLICEYCGVSFKKPAAFTAHVRSHTNKLQKCPEPNCSASFRQISNMKKHFKEEHGVHRHPFPCEQCEASFPLASDLKVHQLRKHEKSNGNKWKCPECGKDFSYPSQLKQHMVSHLGEKNFQCKVCEKSYFKASNLRRHYQNAHLKVYQNMVASGEFRRVKADDELELKEEVQKSPAKERRHKCAEFGCRASFHQIKQLQDHLETIHCIEELYACEDCELTFNDLSAFSLHRKQTHTTHKGPHICTECDKEFPYPSLLRNHVSFVHNGESAICEVCVRPFSRTSHLLRHYRQLHKDFYDKMVSEGKITPRKSRKT